jgi:AcrR family transcriptional regulator
VEAILDAVIKLLKRRSASSVTTNRIAETAGVSIGSLYQYFPNKRAIFAALHERHIGQVDRIMQRQIAKSTESTLEELIASLIDGMIEAHATRNCQIYSRQKCRIGLTARAISRFDFTARSAKRLRPMSESLDREPISICEPFS